jgi:glycosyltransferase involved in cell wall biosynthesis
MHILIMPSWYSTPQNPVRGSFFRDQALMLLKAGHKVGLIVPPSRQRTWHGLSELRSNWRQAPIPIVTNNDGLPTYRLPWWGWHGVVSLKARVELVNRAFERYCREQGKPDLIHAHSALYGGFLAARIGQQHELPVVLTEHASYIMKRRLLPGQPAAVRYALQQSDRCFAVGPALAESLRSYEPTVHAEIVGNVIDTEFFTAGDSTPPEKPFIFCLVAHLYRNKRVDVLLRAFAGAFRDQPVELHIGGDGRERDRLTQLAKALTIQDQVKWLGRLSREEVRDLLRNSHALVSSSDVETFGVTVAEAMACGKPVIVTRSGGPEYFVTEDVGRVVMLDAVEDLSRAMRNLREHYADYDPQQIRSICVRQFSAAAIIEQLESTYRSLIP